MSFQRKLQRDNSIKKYNNSEYMCNLCGQEIIDLCKIHLCKHEFCFQCLYQQCKRQSPNFCPKCNTRFALIQYYYTVERPTKDKPYAVLLYDLKPLRIYFIYALLCKERIRMEEAFRNGRWFGNQEDYEKRVSLYKEVIKVLTQDWTRRRFMKSWSEDSCGGLMDKMLRAVQYGYMPSYSLQMPDIERSSVSYEEVDAQRSEKDIIEPPSDQLNARKHWSRIGQQMSARQMNRQPTSYQTMSAQPTRSQTIRGRALNRQGISGQFPRVQPTRGQPMPAHQQIIESKMGNRLSKMVYPSGAQGKNQSAKPEMSQFEKMAKIGLNGKLLAGLSLLGMTIYQLGLIQWVD